MKWILTAGGHRVFWEHLEGGPDYGGGQHDESGGALESSQEEEEIQEVLTETETQATDLQENVDESLPPAGIHETLDSDANTARTKRRLQRSLRRSDRIIARQESLEQRTQNVIDNTKALDKIENDKYDMVEDTVISRLKRGLKQQDKNKKERREVYAVITEEFLEFWDNDPQGYVETGTIPGQIMVANHIQGMSPMVFTYEENKRLFDRLAEKDKKFDELVDDALKQQEEFDKLNADGDVTKAELKQSSVFSNRQARIIARFDRREDRQPEKYQKQQEKVNSRFSNYADKVGAVDKVTTSVDVYEKKGKKKVEYAEGTRDATDFDRLAIVLCDYNFDSDITPKPLKEQFRRSSAFARKMFGETKTGRYARKSAGEAPNTISASQLYESMRIAGAEVGEAQLIKHIAHLINENAYSNSQYEEVALEPLDENISSTNQLFDAITSDYRYIVAFRQALENYNNNVTDMLTLGGLNDGTENIYLNETRELIAFDALKQQEIATDLAQLQLDDVKKVRESMENDPTLTEEQKQAIIDFHEQVTQKAEDQQKIMLKRLQDIEKSGLVTDPMEQKHLQEQIRTLSDSKVAIPHLTLQGIMAFMMFHYQAFDTRTTINTDINGNKTTVIEKGYYDNGTFVPLETATTGPDGATTKSGSISLKERLKRTSLNAFGIGAGGSLLNFQKRRPRYADNLSRGVNLGSAIGFDNKQFEQDQANLEAKVAQIQQQIDALDPNDPANTATIQDLENQKAAAADENLGKDYKKRGYSMGINVGYNGSVGLGQRIGNTQYYPVNLYFGAGLGATADTIAGFSLGAYGYAGTGWMWNKGKLQRTLDAKSSKESGITGTTGVGLINGSGTLGANAQFSILKKDYIKGYEIIADSIATKGVPALTQIIQQLQSRAGDDGVIKQLKPEELKVLIMDVLRKDRQFDRSKRNSVAVDRMATRMYRMMKMLYPGIDTQQGARMVDDLNNPELLRGVANNLAFQMSLNWLNENYDKLKGLKLTGLSIDLNTILLIMGGVALGPWFFAGAGASFLFANADRMRKSRIQEEDPTSARNASVLEQYNIGAREITGEFLHTQLDQVNAKINILCNTKGIEYAALNTDGTVSLIGDALLPHASTVPVYLNPKYAAFYKTMKPQDVNNPDKFHPGLVVPGTLASGILTSIGKTKHGALYIGYDKDDHNMFQDPASNPESAILWTGQEYGGNPHEFGSASGYDYAVLKTQRVEDTTNQFQQAKQAYALQFTAPSTLVIQTRSEPKNNLATVDMGAKSIEFTCTEQADGTYQTSYQLVDNASGEFQITQIIIHKETEGTPEEIKNNLTFEYTTDAKLTAVLGQIDPNRDPKNGPSRSGLKGMVVNGKNPYKELSHIMDKKSAIQRELAATYANQIVKQGKLGDYVFTKDSKQEIVRFMQELIGSQYCSVSNGKVEVGKGQGFGAMMSSRTAGFEQRWANDAETKQVPSTVMQSVRNASLQGMFDHNKSLGLNLSNYRQQTQQVSFDEQDSSLLGVIYGYNGENKTHDEKLVLSPRLVAGSQIPITDMSMIKYTMDQIITRYDATFGAGAFVGALNQKTGLTNIGADLLNEIRGGSKTSLTIDNVTIEFNPVFFFYPECFNEGVGLDIKVTKVNKTSKPGETVKTSATIAKKEASGPLGFFVNNITTGMTTQKRSLKGAFGAGVQVLPSSSTIIENEEKPSSTTVIETGPLSDDPAANIADGTYTVTTQSGGSMTLSTLNGTDNTVGYIFEDPTTGNPTTVGSMQEFLDQYGSQLDQGAINGLNNYDQAYTPVPGAPTTTTTVTQAQPPDIVSIGYNKNSDDMIIRNASSDLQNPDKTARNPRQQALRTRRSRLR